ncbi:MAG: ATP-dependent metallopeptidase FtsH/Yme1/Tma family protein, partial [Mangrovicoccus sp.]
MGNARNIAFWVVLFLLILALFNLFSGGQSTMSSRSISYSDFVEAVDNGEVHSVTLDGEKALIRGNDGNDYVAIIPQGTDITDELIAKEGETVGLDALLATLSEGAGAPAKAAPAASEPASDTGREELEIRVPTLGESVT